MECNFEEKRENKLFVQLNKEQMILHEKASKSDLEDLEQELKKNTLYSLRFKSFAFVISKFQIENTFIPANDFLPLHSRALGDIVRKSSEIYQVLKGGLYLCFASINPLSIEGGKGILQLFKNSDSVLPSQLTIFDYKNSSKIFLTEFSNGDEFSLSCNSGVTFSNIGISLQFVIMRIEGNISL